MRNNLQFIWRFAPQLTLLKKNFWATYSDSSSLKIRGCIIYDAIVCKYCGFDCLHSCSARTVRKNEVIRKKDCSYPLQSCQSDRMFGLTMDWNWIFGLIFRLVGNSQLRPQIRPNCYCQLKNLCRGLGMRPSEDPAWDLLRTQPETFRGLGMSWSDFWKIGWLNRNQK